jgi:hypothetical protein
MNGIYLKRRGKTKEIPRQVSRRLGPNSYSVPPQCKTEALPLKPTCSLPYTDDADTIWYAKLHYYTQQLYSDITMENGWAYQMNIIRVQKHMHKSRNV